MTSPSSRASSATSTITRLGLVVAGAFLAYAFVACATGDVADPAATADGSAPHDAGSGDANKDAKDGGVDTGPVCADAAPLNTCTTPIDLGTIALGKTAKADATLAPANNDAWFKMTFTGLDDPTAHPHVVLGGASASSLLLEVSKNCSGGDLACGSEDASASAVNEFESTYAQGAGDGGDEAGDDPEVDPANPGEAGVFVPLTLGPGGVLYVRVYRKLGSPGPCAPFELTVSN